MSYLCVENITTCVVDFKFRKHQCLYVCNIISLFSAIRLYCFFFSQIINFLFIWSFIFEHCEKKMQTWRWSLRLWGSILRLCRNNLLQILTPYWFGPYCWVLIYVCIYIEKIFLGSSRSVTYGSPFRTYQKIFLNLI